MGQWDTGALCDSTLSVPAESLELDMGQWDTDALSAAVIRYLQELPSPVVPSAVHAELLAAVQPGAGMACVTASLASSQPHSLFSQSFILSHILTL